jgi:vitamin B12 transporter
MKTLQFSSPFDRSLTQGAGSLAGDNSVQIFRVSTLVVCGLAACASVFAKDQDPGKEQDQLIADTDTIIVTASRSPLATADVGSSVTIITREQIEQRQARYVTDLLRAVPGVAISHSGATGAQAQVRIRGAEANHVLVLIDGVRANDPASGDEFKWELLSTSNIERIEVIRGPQSALWGSDALAGVVHIVTRSGSDRPKVGGFVEAGSRDTLNAGVHGGIGGNKWSLGFGLERLDTAGTNVSRTGTELDPSDMTTASLYGKYQPTENLQLDLGLRAVDAYTQFDPVDYLVTGLPIDGDVATESTQASAHLGGTLTTLSGQVLHHLNAKYFDSSNDNLTEGVLNSATASKRTTLAYQSDIQLSENMLSVALEHELTEFEQRGEISFGDPNQDQEMNVSSLIAEFQGKSIDRLTWLLSARYDDNSDFDGALTGRISGACQINDVTRIRSNIGTGQKSPTFIERFGYYPGQFIGNADLQPETSTSFDVGIEQVFMDGSFEWQFAVFKQNLENEINGFVYDPESFLFTAENMDGKSTRQGVEFSAVYDVTEELELGASYTYTDSSESTDAGDVDELRRPRHAGSVSANYRFLQQRAQLALTADYGGSRTDIFFPPYPEPSEMVTLGSYWLLDFTASYQFGGNSNVYIRATNLLDENYEQVFGYQTAGRAAYLGLRVDFGK